MFTFFRAKPQEGYAKNKEKIEGQLISQTDMFGKKVYYIYQDRGAAKFRKIRVVPETIEQCICIKKEEIPDHAELNIQITGKEETKYSFIYPFIINLSDEDGKIIGNMKLAEN